MKQLPTISSRELAKFRLEQSIKYERLPEPTPLKDSGSPQSQPGDSDDKEHEDAGEPVDISENVYGAVLFSVIHDGIELRSHQDHDRLQKYINVMRVTFVWVSLIFNYALQGSLLWFSYYWVVSPSIQNAQQLYREYHAECFDIDGTYNHEKCDDMPEERKDELCSLVLSSFWFLYLILALWWMTMLKEFRKTMQTWRKISHMPHTNSYEDQVEQDGDVQYVKRMVPEVKWLLFFIMILPKQMISVGLLFIGTWWLGVTDSMSELILNALALAFVIDTDELIFDALFPESMTEELSKVKLWRTSRKTLELQRWAAYRRSAFYWLLVLLGVYVYLVVLQRLPFIGPMPGYMNDIHCESYWSKEEDLRCKGWAVWNGANCFPYGVGMDDSPQTPIISDMYR
mmetsp:Transcript_53564/g.114467  ORF Transcript_53564/g.114467 Transcript_53564/m.114467 type:complete len:399 (+) Transcript_53564:37-1233(+)